MEKRKTAGMTEEGRARARGKEFLSRARLMQEEVEAKYQQIAILTSMAEQITRILPEVMVSQTRDVTSGQTAAIRLMEAREEVEKKVLEMLDVRQEIAEMIARVPIPKCRLMLEKRYLCNMKLEAIADDVHMDMAWVRRLISRGNGIVGGMLSGPESSKRPEKNLQ